METNTIAGSYRSKQNNMSNQLNIDIALRLIKLTLSDIERLIEGTDRHFDAMRAIPAQLSGLTSDGINVTVEFEDYTGTFFVRQIQDLSIDDKIYLLEEIEKL